MNIYKDKTFYHIITTIPIHPYIYFHNTSQHPSFLILPQQQNIKQIACLIISNQQQIIKIILIELLMYEQKIKVNVQTNNGIKFITAISPSLTVRQILPILTQKYSTVVQQNFKEDQYNTEQHQGNRITQINKNGYLIALDELVRDIFNDNDLLFINLTKKSEAKIEKSKKKIIENKIKEKEINEKIKEDKQQKKKQEKSEKKEEKVVKNHKETQENKIKIKEDKKEQQKEGVKKSYDVTALLSKLRNDNLSKSQVVKSKKVEQKKKPQIVEEESSDS